MGLIFSLPFIGFVIGWFFAGAFVTAPASVELMGTNNGYRFGLIIVGLLGLVVIAAVAGLEVRLRERVQSGIARFAVSFSGVLSGFCAGFLPPFMILLAFAEPLV